MKNYEFIFRVYHPLNLPPIEMYHFVNKMLGRGRDLVSCFDLLVHCTDLENYPFYQELQVQRRMNFKGAGDFNLLLY